MSEPTLAGDWKDDDGIVLNSMIQENTDSQKDRGEDLPRDAFVPEQEKPKAVSRLIGTEIVLKSGTIVAGQIATASDMPVMVMPADPDRKGLHIHCNSLGVGQTGAGLGSDIVRYSDDPGKLWSRQSAAGVTTSQAIDGMLHTGPVWIFAPETNNAGAGGGMQVWVTAVTL